MNKYSLSLWALKLLALALVMIYPAVFWVIERMFCVFMDLGCLDLGKLSIVSYNLTPFLLAKEQYESVSSGNLKRS
ncbi:hypothetical protein C1N27_13705 [Vibrio diazotrophicus]|nr:hypothetical protein C1N27_13705 [Vibrio diazotrophicus]